MAAIRRRRFFAPTVTFRAVTAGSTTIGMREPHIGPRPPMVVVGPAATLSPPVKVHLAPSPTQARKPYSIPPFPIVVFVLGPFAPIKATLAPSPRQARRTHSVPPWPVVLIAPPLARPTAVHLARIKIPSRMAHLGAPVVVTAAVTQTFSGPVVHRAYSLRGRPKSKLQPPTVVTAAQIFSGPRTHLAYSSRGRTITQLRTPMVVFAAVSQTFTGPETHLARITPPRVHSRLAPPTDTVGLEDQGRVKVWLAYSLRGKAKPRLNPPTVVAPVLAPPIRVKLTNPRIDLPKRQPILGQRWRDSGVYPFGPGSGYFGNNSLFNLSSAGADAAGDIVGTIYTLAEAADVVSISAYFNGVPGATAFRGVIYATDGAGHVLLQPPVAITVETVAPGGGPNTGWYTATCAVTAHLPAGQYLIGVWFGSSAGVQLTDDPSQGLGRYSSSTDHVPNGYSATSSGPAWHDNPGLPSYVANWLVYANFTTGQNAPYALRYPQIGPWPPALSAAIPFTYDLAIKSLAYSSRGRAKSKLSAPTVVTTTTVLAPPIEAHLAYSRRGAPKSILRRPVVVAPVLARPIRVKLAYSLRGRPKSRLRPPTQVFPFIARAIDVTLARIRPPHTIAELRPPTDTTGLEDQGQIRVHLAPSFRGRPLNHLFPPTVVGEVLAPPVKVTLAASFRGTPKSKLSAPTVVAPVLTLHEAIVRLARITPPPVHSILREPVVIDLRPQVRYLATSLAYSRRGAPKSKLTPASSFAPRPQADTTLLVHLAYSVRGRPIYRLGEPSLNLCEIDTFQRTRALGNGWGTADTGQAWTHPDGGNAKFGVNGTQGQMACDVAAAIRTARLPFPTADTDTVVSFVMPTTPVGGSQSMYALGRFTDANNRYGVRLTQATNGTAALALSKRVAGVTSDSLAVKNYVAGAFTPGNVYWLHFRVVGQTLYGKIWADGVAEPTTWDVSIQDTDLTGTGVGVLGFPFAGNTTLPTVLWDNFSACPVTNAQFEGPRTTLVRIRPPRTLARLRPPVAVRIFVARPIDTTLAPSRFPRPKSKLRPPTRTFAFVARPIDITLAPQRRGHPRPVLAPPAVTNPFVVRPIQTTLARITPPPVRSRLHPPTVIGGSITFPGPKVTLVRIQPPATRWFYTRLNVEANPVCYGDVSGFDFAPVVCGDDDSPLVSGFTQGAEVCGDDTGDLATGASAPGGSVTGGDEKREGC